MDVLKECGLVDMGWRGYPFTWSNKRFGTRLIEERLDRFLCNMEWQGNFQTSKVEHINDWCSDHCPILLETGISTWQKKKYKGASRFFYEDMLSSYEE